MEIFKIPRFVLFVPMILLLLTPFMSNAFAADTSEEEYGLQLILIVVITIMTAALLAIEAAKFLLGGKPDKDENKDKDEKKD